MGCLCGSTHSAFAGLALHSSKPQVVHVISSDITPINLTELAESVDAFQTGSPDGLRLRLQ